MLNGRSQDRLRSFAFILTIPVALFSIYIESLDPFSRHFYAPMRLVSYFILGFLAWHSKKHPVALLALIINSMLITIWNDRTRLHEHFVSSGGIILALIFYSSHFSTSLTTLSNRPAFQFLFQINFPLFLFNWIAVVVCFSFIRHFSPGSLFGFIFFVCLSLAVLITLSYYFELLIQRPALSWHDRAWNKLLSSTRTSQHKDTSNRVVVPPHRAILSDPNFSLEPIQPSGR